MADQSAEIEQFAKVLSSAIIGEKEAHFPGISASKLAGYYAEVEFKELPLQKFGCRSVPDLMKLIPNAIEVVREGGQTLYRVKANESNQHVASMVQRQRPKKRASGRKIYKPRSVAPRRTTTTPRQNRWNMSKMYGHNYVPPRPVVVSHFPQVKTRNFCMAVNGIREQTEQDERYNRTRGHFPAGGANSFPSHQYSNLPPRLQNRIPTAEPIAPRTVLKPLNLNVKPLRKVKGNPNEESLQVTVNINRKKTDQTSRKTSGGKSSNQNILATIPHEYPQGGSAPLVFMPAHAVPKPKLEAAAFKVPPLGKIFEPNKKPLTFQDIKQTGDKIAKTKENVKQYLLENPNGVKMERFVSKYEERFQVTAERNLLALLKDSFKDIAVIENIDIANTDMKYSVVYPASAGTAKPVQAPVPIVIEEKWCVKPAGELCLGRHTVYISHVESIHDIWVQLTDSRVKSLTRDMSEHYKKSGLVAPNPKVGKYYAFNLKDTSYRALLTEVLGVHSVKISLVDYGGYYVVDTSELNLLDPKFCNLPAQAMRCKMHGVYTINDQQLKSATTYVSKTYDGRAIYCDVLRKEDLFYICNFSDKEDMTVINDDLLAKGKVSPFPKVNEPPLYTLPGESEYTVFVTYVTNSATIVVNIELEQYAHALCDLEQKIREFYKGEEYHVEEVYVGEVYIGKVKDMSDKYGYYRVKVVAKDEDGEEVEVELLDQGGTYDLTKADLFPVKPEFLKLPYQAIEVKLWGLETVEGNDGLEEILEQKIMGEYRIATVDRMIVSEDGQPFLPVVSLYDIPLEDGVEEENLNHTILKAILKSVNVAPKLCQPTDTVLSQGFVINVNDCGEVYIHIEGPSMQALDELATIMEQKKIADEVAKVENPQHNSMYFACHNGVWKRVKLDKLCRNEVHLDAVDYGDKVILRKPWSLYESADPRVNDWPPLALKCVLNDLPPVGTTWTYQASRVFLALVQQLSGGHMVTFENYITDFDIAKGLLPVVHIYYFDDDGVLQSINIAMREKADAFCKKVLPVKQSFEARSPIEVTSSSDEQADSLSLDDGTLETEGSSSVGSTEYDDEASDDGYELDNGISLCNLTKDLDALTVDTSFNTETNLHHTNVQNGNNYKPPVVIRPTNHEMSPASIDRLASCCPIMDDMSPSGLADIEEGEILDEVKFCLPHNGEQVLVTWSGSPVDFMCVKKSNLPLLADMKVKLEQWHGAFPKQVTDKEVVQGSFFSAKNEEGEFGRVEVYKKTKCGQIQVKYIDVGYYKLVSHQEICRLPADYLPSTIPPLAFKAALCVVSQYLPFDEAVCDFFKELADNKTFTVYGIMDRKCFNRDVPILLHLQAEDSHFVFNTLKEKFFKD